MKRVQQAALRGGEQRLDDARAQPPGQKREDVAARHFMAKRTAFLTEQGVNGPFMVVGPLSTLHNWHNEFKKWAPKLDSLIYHGAKDDRKQ